MTLVHFVGMSFASIEDATDSALMKSLAMVYFYTHVTALKYMGAFLLSEGSSMLSGVAYNGEKKVKNILISDWSGCKNNNAYMVSLLFII